MKKKWVPLFPFGFCENLLTCKNHAYNEYKIMEKSIEGKDIPVQERFV